jgi:hypothetical protein
MSIEEILEKWFEKNNINKDLIKDNSKMLKEAFIAGYNQAIEDRRKIEG